jgi:hypothetical protein
MSSESFWQQICSMSSSILQLYSPQRLLTRRLTLMSLAHLTWGEGRGSLPGCNIWVRTAELQATANSSCCSKEPLHFQMTSLSNYAWHAEPVLRIPMLCLWFTVSCLHNKFRVRTVYRDLRRCKYVKFVFLTRKDDFCSFFQTFHVWTYQRPFRLISNIFYQTMFDYDDMIYTK